MFLLEKLTHRWEVCKKIRNLWEVLIRASNKLCIFHLRKHWKLWNNCPNFLPTIILIHWNTVRTQSETITMILLSSVLPQQILILRISWIPNRVQVYQRKLHHLPNQNNFQSILSLQQLSLQIIQTVQTLRKSWVDLQALRFRTMEWIRGWAVGSAVNKAVPMWTWMRIKIRNWREKIS